MGTRTRRECAALLAGLVLAAGCSGGGDGSDDGGAGGAGRGAGGAPGPATAPIPAIAELTPLSVSRDGRARIVDDAGREVLLRGANLNALGDYHQDDPDLAPTQPPTADDWDQMAANGFSVVRLVVSWSALEPERGEIDGDYVDRIRTAVDEAAARGIYTVIDFHQDAYGKFVATPDGTTCPDGTEPAIGWDGAPEWATLTDGESTCRPPGYREGAPAVQAAFRNFYANADGIRDAYVATVGRVAAEFADEPAVAGYDQWRQHCGEPHTVGNPGSVADERVVQLNFIDCPGDRDGGPNEDVLAIVGRAYPRAAPGELTELRSDAATGSLVVAGTTGTAEATVPAGEGDRGELVVWVRGIDDPTVTVTGLAEPTVTPVDGGAYVTALPTGGPYRLELGQHSATGA